MRAQDVIRKKRNGEMLQRDEIEFLIAGAMDESIPKYQISAFLMAVYFKGMNSEETGYLTETLIGSGKTMSLAAEHAPYVDKHSTGGVGDGTSLVVAPILAACGIHVPMISGRALGHTGGTLDKLDSIPQYRTQLSAEQFARTVERHGYAMSGQTQELTPADKYLYALRDVTATVESIPLITSSILSKKFAEGADVLILDVKCGRGAFARERKFAQALARQLIETGGRLGKTVRAAITNMDQPLGIMIGNFLEIEQAAAVLGGYKSDTYTEDRQKCLRDFVEVSKYLCAQALIGGKRADNIEKAMEMIDEVISTGKAWKYFCDNISTQGGDLERLRGMFGRRRARHTREVKSEREGYVRELDAYIFGIAAATLGVGRLTTESDIDYEAGIELRRKRGDRVRAGETLCVLYSNNESALDEAERQARQGISLSETYEDEASGASEISGASELILETM